ncbi:QueT transporter family protein [uncultured Ruminococcus sp.]|uniref:QueT transporter family protein n=1 Tax=uncultured Ruminococcus sp. TaxID=165186 RepID=UPI00293094F4|nr:QueT transporter family protein [uncultured Ruminococcus sp.]
MKDKRVLYITQAAIIAALYAVLTIGQNALLPGTASAAVQFRVAEVLCVLAIYTPAAIPGLTIGCIIANISSVTAGLGFYDMIFGSLASLLAALAMYGLRNVRIKNIPFLALLMPALFNGVIVGLEISIFFSDTGFSFVSFLITGGCVALGELVVLLVLGIPACLLLNKHGKKMGIVLD